MKVLFIGGTGNISTPCSRELLRRGIELVHLNRGNRSGTFPEGTVRTIHCDLSQDGALEQALGSETFDVVVDWLVYEPEQVTRDIRILRGRTAQYIFISTASAYRKPPIQPLITESTHLANPYWPYSAKKIACEKILNREWEETGFPVTIVRPSHTYGERWLPTSFGARDFTTAARILDGKEIPVHGDGQSIWVLTHAEDFARGFAGLVGNPQALGEAVHITSDELLTWDRIHELLAAALKKEARIVHLPLDFIAARAPELALGLKGDKSYSFYFDNSKIRGLVPDFHPRIRFAEGIRRSVEYLESHPELKVIDREKDQLMDSLIAEYRSLF